VKCPDCGHQHAGVELGQICVGCPCRSVPAIVGPPAGWCCEAYGPDAAAVLVAAGRPACFVADAFGRPCRGPGECAALMAAERRRVFQRVNELAAAGDPVAVYLAETFSGPDQLLGGPA